MPHRPRLLMAIVAGPLLLGGCATVHREPLATATPHAPPPRPELPATLAAVTPPPADGTGGYRTINSGIGEDRIVWHVRAALNVAAIACRGPQDAGLVAAYNAMLSSKKALLADANRSFARSVTAATGDSDAYMTRLYNFFAMPAAKPGFCAAADTLAPQAAETPPQAFAAFAEDALPRLEAPFLAAYREVDAYRLASAAWDARYGKGEGAPTELAAGTGERGPTGPRLAYADLGEVFAWTPHRGARLAAR